MSIWGLLESTATAIRPGIGRDAIDGVTQNFTVGQTPAPTVVFSNVACSYQEQGISVMDLYGQRQTMLRPRLYFAIDPKVEVNDRITVTTKNQDGTTTQTNLLVQGGAQPVARGRQWEVEVERINQPT